MLALLTTLAFADITYEAYDNLAVVESPPVGTSIPGEPTCVHAATLRSDNRQELRGVNFTCGASVVEVRSRYTLGVNQEWRRRITICFPGDPAARAELPVDTTCTAVDTTGEELFFTLGEFIAEF